MFALHDYGDAKFNLRGRLCHKYTPGRKKIKLIAATHKCKFLEMNKWNWKWQRIVSNFPMCWKSWKALENKAIFCRDWWRVDWILEDYRHVALCHVWGKMQTSKKHFNWEHFLCRQTNHLTSITIKIVWAKQKPKGLISVELLHPKGLSVSTDDKSTTFCVC